MKSTRRWQQLLLNSLAIILGNALYSLAVALFLEPAGLITGGATGIALAFGRLTGLSVSGFLFLFNMSMLVWGWAVLGKKFALNTLASSVLSPAFLGLFERLLDGRVLTEDIFLCTIFSGLSIGVALGMVIRAGASTGGMDIPPLVLQKWFRWPVSITMMLFDIAILLVQAAFSQPEQVLYGIVLVITHTIVMDKMLMLGDSRTEVKIISTRSDEIRTAILAEIDRGVTVLHGEGGYTGEPSEVLLSVISNRELPRLEKLVATIRSREISACLVLQAQSQLKAIYKDNADTIIGNMDSSIFLGGKEPTTLKELEAVLGKETIDTYNTGESRGRETSHSLNYQKLGKALMSQDELAVMDGGKCILQLRGVRPFLSDKYDITQHPNYKYTADADPKNAFDIEGYLKARLKLKPNQVCDVYEIDAAAGD